MEKAQGEEKKSKNVQKNEAYAPWWTELLVDNNYELCYNDTPYCDSMPIYGYSIQHGHFTTVCRRCQDAKTQKWQRRLAYQKHTIRKKGCDDPYGNGQGRNVRQDHA